MKNSKIINLIVANIEIKGVIQTANIVNKAKIKVIKISVIKSS